MIRKNDYIGFEELIAESITLMNQLTALKKWGVEAYPRAVRQHEGEHGLFEHGTRGPKRGLFYGEPFEGE